MGLEFTRLIKAIRITGGSPITSTSPPSFSKAVITSHLIPYNLYVLVGNAHTHSSGSGRPRLPRCSAICLSKILLLNPSLSSWLPFLYILSHLNCFVLVTKVIKFVFTWHVDLGLSLAIHIMEYQLCKFYCLYTSPSTCICDCFSWNIPCFKTGNELLPLKIMLMWYCILIEFLMI